MDLIAAPGVPFLGVVAWKVGELRGQPKYGLGTAT
jgi:hypothetical protein